MADGKLIPLTHNTGADDALYVSAVDARHFFCADTDPFYLRARARPRILDPVT